MPTELTANDCEVTRLHKIDASTVDDYIATRRGEHIGKASARGDRDPRRTVKATTIDKELGTLRQILRLCLRRGWYHRPLESVLPKSAGGEYEPLDRALTWEQVPKLLAALPESRAATCTFIVAFAADVCAIPRATLDDLGSAKTWQRPANGPGYAQGSQRRSRAMVDEAKSALAQLDHEGAETLELAGLYARSLESLAQRMQGAVAAGPPADKAALRSAALRLSRAANEGMASLASVIIQSARLDMLATIRTLLQPIVLCRRSMVATTGRPATISWA